MGEWIAEFDDQAIRNALARGKKPTGKSTFDGLHQWFEYR